MFNVDGSTDVSFIVRTENGADFWHIAPSGHYAADCQRGKDAAAELMRQMWFGDNPLLLKSVAEAIVRKGSFGGLEIGFFRKSGRRFSAARTKSSA